MYFSCVGDRGSSAPNKKGAHYRSKYVTRNRISVLGYSVNSEDPVQTPQHAAPD